MPAIRIWQTTALIAPRKCLIHTSPHTPRAPCSNTVDPFSFHIYKPTKAYIKYSELAAKLVRALPNKKYELPDQ